MVSVKVEGGAQLAKALRSIASFEEERAAMLTILKTAAEPIQRRTAELVGVSNRQGPHLKDSIKIQALTKVDDSDFRGSVELDTHEFAVAVGPSKDTFWGFFQEYGTVHHPPRPAMRPAFDQTQNAVMQKVQHGIWALLLKLTRRNG